MEGGRKEGHKEEKYVYFLLLNNSLGENVDAKNFQYLIVRMLIIYRNDVGKENLQLVFCLMTRDL